MFRLLGNGVARFWPIVLAGWALLLGVSWLFAPSWESVTQAGELSSLPADTPSRLAEDLFREAFPDQYAASNIVVVAERQGEELRDADRDFIKNTLAPRLRETAEQAGGPEVFARVRAPSGEASDVLYVSQDRRAALTAVDLTTQFLDLRNNAVVAAVEDLTARLGDEGSLPQGLTLVVTGIATGGRDYLHAERQSIRSIDRWTIVIVVLLLLALYRAPVTALIPLVTVYVGVQTALNLLAILAGAGILTLDRSNKIFITVLAYGAGVDYCVFLLARYREELEKGAEPREAAAHAVARVGAAITASAGTVICGIATLAAARFGKVHQAGIVIPIALVLVLAAALTLTVSLLRLAGRWAFWPQPLAGSGKPERHPDWLGRLAGRQLLPDVWEKFGPLLLRRPALIWSITVAAMMPFVVIALLHYRDQIYNPLSGMPPDAPSTIANQTLERHFPAGIAAPVVVLFKSAWEDYTEEKSIDAVARLLGRLMGRQLELEIADARAVSAPLGTGPAASEVLGYLPAAPRLLPPQARQRAIEHYVSHTPEWAQHVTHLDVILNVDPFATSALGNIHAIESALRLDVPAGELALLGATASGRDLTTVKQGDQRRAELLVPAVVLALLLLVLRKAVISVYLVLSVLFSYAAALGVTLTVFGLTHWGGYQGLDWKVPIFLFTILVAVGEDYNIFLMTRIQEEIGPHGPERGVTEALKRTGKVISACGFIMAGTFATLLTGSLLAIKELGFALAFGILLDTLVVRPILVPAFLLMLQKGRLGRLGRAHALVAEPPKN